MSHKHLVTYLVGLLVTLRHFESRDERGLSQSAENAVLLAGAVAVATVVIIAMKAFVTSKMPK
jgi:hypothetical protein